MLTTPNLFIVVALGCEAKPLVDYFRLTKQKRTGFSCFAREADEYLSFNINLIVSGVGARNMSAACGYLGANSRKDNCVWLNVGIAGHKEHELGEIVRVNKASEYGAVRNHYPAQVAKWSEINTSLMSYSEPCTDYP